jgi:hypothetical protein
MLLNKIYEWARIAPTKPALIYNDNVWDYADFAKAIALARKLLQKENLPQQTTVVILARNLFASWPIIIAVRSLGLNTITVPSLEVAQSLQIADVSRIVTTDLGYEFFKLPKHPLPGIGVSIVPNFVQAEIHTANLPETPDGISAPGAHILYTSGTTGTYKSMGPPKINRIRSEHALIQSIVAPYTKPTMFSPGPKLGLGPRAQYGMSAVAWFLIRRVMKPRVYSTQLSFSVMTSISQSSFPGN